MGAWLARLKNQEGPGAHATKPTKLLQGDEQAGFVGSVAYPPTPPQKIERGEKPNDPAKEDDERILCWLNAIDSTGQWTDPAAVEELMERARTEPTVRDYFLLRAEDLSIPSL